MNQYCLAVDIGATKAAIALVNQELKIIDRCEVSTGNNQNIWSEIEQATLSLIERNSAAISEIGIGSAGPINLKDGAISPVNISTWRAFPIVEKFSKLLNVKKVRLCGDAIALALAESKIGAGKDVDSFLGMVVSTGVGGALVLNRKIYHGSSGNAGYFGHHSISFALSGNENKERCACGRTGCVELFASGPKMVEDAINSGWKNPRPNFENLAADARAGDQNANKSIDKGAKALAVGIVNVLDILDINTVIIGGGVSKAGAIYWERLVAHVNQEAIFAEFLQQVDLRLSNLSSDAGLIGAAILAMED